MNNFKNKLYKKIKISQLNDYGIENFDEVRFGPYPFNIETESKRCFYKKKILKNFIKKKLAINNDFNPKLVDDFIKQYLIKFERIYYNISKKDQNLLISLIAYRLLGFRKVMLPRNNKNYWKSMEKAKDVVDNDEVFNPGFLHFLLKKANLKSIGYDISLLYHESGIATNFLIEQYAYKYKDKEIISAELGDVVLDIGGCWGDTALYFAHKVGENGKVYSFEFIPNNIDLFNKNISLNRNMIERIELVEFPVTKKSGQKVYFEDCGPASKVSYETFDGYTGISETISIDDFVSSKNIGRVDLIKMDIEGTEMQALNGAINTIKQYRPKLAIAIYHSIEDFVNIPNWILDLNYEIFIDHYTIHMEETICFARPK
jgi:FkbM family methyltransferase